jgi:putative transposase
MVTRRCTQRQFLMRPDRETNNAFIYRLVVAAEKAGVQILFTAAMSNHHHAGIHDPHGNYPAFIEHFHKLFAKCQKALRGRRENFWSSEQTSVVRLVDPDDIIDKMIYALTNPVKDGLVERAPALAWRHISGLAFERYAPRRNPPQALLPRRRTYARDRASFARSPTRLYLRTRFATLVSERVRAVEETAAAERRRTGTQVLGRSAILKQRWSDRPGSREPRRQVNPRVAARSKWSRTEALLRNRAFRDAYAASREAFAAGIQDLLFPAGTYWLRRFAHAPCVPLPDPA